MKRLDVCVRNRLANPISRLGRLRSSSVSHRIRAAAAVSLLAVSGICVHAAEPASAPAASASSIAGKYAMLNGAPITAGATLFPGDVIRMGEASTAVLQFGNSSVLATADTELVVQSESVSLRSGRVQVRASSTESFAVSGPFFQVSIAASGGAPSSAEIRLGGMRAQISAVAGFADVASEGYDSAYRLRAGETATLDASATDASQTQDTATVLAGQISRVAPQVEIDRGVQHLVAAVSEGVNWEDDLRSGPTGRAHVTLNDGSLLNLGSDSSLLILKHDAQAQQTSLDLVIGRVRGQIIKLTRPGAKFEVQTPVGVAGLVGTDFSLQVTDDYVELIVFDGVVRFTTLAGKFVSVNAGMKLRISRAGAFDGPSTSTPQEEQIAKDQTDITGAPGNPASQSAVATGKRHLVPIIVTASAAGAAGLGIGIWEITRPKVSNSAP